MTSKTIAVALAVMLTTVGGVAAMTGTGPAATADGTTAVSDADVAATYDGTKVTVTVTANGAPVENASVEMADGEFVTDENGTVSAELTEADDLAVEVETDGFEGELEYEVVDESLVIQEEEYEYENDSEGREDEEGEEEDEREGEGEDREDGEEKEDEDEDSEDEDDADEEDEEDDESDA